MNKKEIFALIGLFLVVIIISSCLVSASWWPGNAGADAGAKAAGGSPSGASDDSKTADEGGAAGFDYYLPPFLKNLEFSKISIMLFMLVLFFAFILASLYLVDFPPTLILKIVLALVGTILLTWLIPFNDIVVSLMGFTGVYIAIYLTIPILILSFVSYVLATKLKSFFGVFFQRLMWIFYSFYLLLKALTLGRGFIGPIVAEKMDFLPNWFLEFISGPKASAGLFFLHLFMFAMVFYIFVWRNRDIISLVNKQIQTDKLRKYSEKMDKAEAKRNAWAES